MREPWLPIATHGDSEEQVREAMLDWCAAAMPEFRQKLRAEGLPHHVIEKAMAFVDSLQRKQIEKDLPNIMRDMAISAGAAPPMR